LFNFYFDIVSSCVQIWRLGNSLLHFWICAFDDTRSSSRSFLSTVTWGFVDEERESEDRELCQRKQGSEDSLTDCPVMDTIRMMSASIPQNGSKGSHMQWRKVQTTHQSGDDKRIRATHDNTTLRKNTATLHWILASGPRETRSQKTMSGKVDNWLNRCVERHLQDAKSLCRHGHGSAGYARKR
jgi:hypothetical protein